MTEKHYDMMIVGAGLSGLTAASYLSRAGYSVLVLEKTANCGGLLNSFSRDGYVFDSGARSIENSGIIKPMLRDLDIDIELLKSPVSIGIESSVIDMNTKESIANYQQLLESLYPNNVADIKKIFRVIAKVYASMQVIYGFENPVFKNFREDKKYLLKELLPWLGKFLLAASHMERLDEPVETFLSKITTNQSLIDIIDQHFFKRTPTFFALGYFYVYQDYLYPKGGTGVLPSSMVQKILQQGGEILTETEVTAIKAGQKLLKTHNGKSFTYDKLLWCADAKTLYRNLHTTDLPSSTVTAITNQSQKIFASRGGDSVFSLFLGVSKPPEEFAKISNGHLFYTPVKQGLGETHLSKLSAILAKGKEATKTEIFAWTRAYCTLTTYEISIPSLRDANLSPPGKTSLVVSFLLEYDLVQLVYDNGWYDEFKLFIENTMIETLGQSLFPTLLDSIELRFSSSPLTIETVFNSSEGGSTGWTYESPTPAVQKLLKIASSVKTPIPDVLHCGQWAYSPAGIPTAILTGWYAADAIIRQKV